MSKPLPETLRKLQAREQQEKAEYMKRRDQLISQQNARNTRIAERSRTYASELIQQEKDTLVNISKAEKDGSYFIPSSPKVALVIRIKGLVGIDPDSKKVLRLFRLLQRNNATFVRLNKATTEMLRKVEPYIAYGYPSAQMVRKLIYERGYASINGQRLPLTSNEVVRIGLGHYGIESVEDLAHEIYTCGPNFAAANRFLWTFKLNTPKGGLNGITSHYNEGGDAGNRENLIDGLVDRML